MYNCLSRRTRIETGTGNLRVLVFSESWQGVVTVSRDKLVVAYAEYVIDHTQHEKVIRVYSSTSYLIFMLIETRSFKYVEN